MIIVIRPHTSKEQIDQVIREVEILGYTPAPIHGATQTVVAAIGDERTHANLESLTALPQVESVLRVQKRYKLASRESHPANTLVDVAGVEIGGSKFCLMAGPCSVESEDQLLATAESVKAAGATILRGGAYKPRTSPYEFQGLGEEALRLLRRAGSAQGLGVVTEVMSEQDLPMIVEYADMLQIGSRNMQNFALLKAVGATNKPVLLKRGLSATIQEFLLAAEYIASQGNLHIVLCERGIRTFDNSTRNTCDLGGVSLLKELTHLPVVVDPSHATGRRSLVAPLSRAAAAVGADGIMVEVHPMPEEALSDGQQSLSFGAFADLHQQLAPYVNLRALQLRLSPTTDAAVPAIVASSK